MMKRFLILTIAMTGLALPVLATAAGGDLDPSFGSGGKVLSVVGSPFDEGAAAVALEPRGSLVVAGYTFGSQSRDFASIRFSADGSIDSSYGDDGHVITDLGAASNDQASDAKIEPGGKILLAGSSNASHVLPDFALVRYNRDGSLDQSFGTNGRVLTDFGSIDTAYAMALAPGGKIVLAGSSEVGFALARYNGDGSLDTTFGNGGRVRTRPPLWYSVAFDVAITPGGKIVAAGYTPGTSTRGDFMLARYNSDGSLDDSFGSNGIVLTDLGADSSDGASALVLAPDGKIVVAGYSNAARGSIDFALVRYEADGTLDQSFGSDGKVFTDFGSTDFAWALALGPRGQIVAAGSTASSGSDFAVARYDRNGALDPTFGSGGTTTTDFGGGGDVAEAVAIEPGGKIVAAGDGFAGSRGFAVARYLAR